MAVRFAYLQATRIAAFGILIYLLPFPGETCKRIHTRPGGWYNEH